jgi:hypothetical protein
MMLPHAPVAAGIDEAGYGPLLGPLVVGLAAAGAATDDMGDGTRAVSRRGSAGATTGPATEDRLRGALAALGSTRGSRFVVGDSKQIFQQGNLAPLETAALVVSTWMHGAPPATLGEWLARHAAGPSPDLDSSPWYGAAPRDLELPLAADRGATLALAERLDREGRRRGVRIVRLAVRVALEDEYNARCEEYDSKARLLFALNVELLDDLRATVQGPYAITCDRHGGRTRYLELLRATFPAESAAAIAESDSDSRYLVGCDRGAMHLAYRVAADSSSTCTSLASILAKYTREILMEAFNRHFAARSPAVRRTAGYYQDGLRFLAELEAHQALDAAEKQRLLRRR